MNCNGICSECKGWKPKERLFRGKRIDNNEWFVGFNISSVWVDGFDLVVLSDHSNNIGVHPQTICEFTGALDKNGTKIFEGDIIDLPGWIVSYSTGMNCCYGMQAGWCIQRDNWESWMELQNTDEMVVIGNIHDNPELISKEK